MIDCTPTAAKLKHGLDRGRGGDKVDNIDPAVAPLGTDEEAAGVPVPGEAVRSAYRAEIGSSVSSERQSDWAIAIYIFVVLAIAVFIFGSIYFLPGP